LLQSLADGINSFEGRPAPTGADRFCFACRPIRLLCQFLRVPRLAVRQRGSGEGDECPVFFMLAVLSSEVFGVVLAGYASASKWSLFGGVREGPRW